MGEGGSIDQEMLGAEPRLRFAEEGETFRGIELDDSTTLSSLTFPSTE